MTEQKEILLNFLNNYLPIVALIGFIFIVIFYILYFFKFKKEKKSKFVNMVKSIALPLAFFSSLFATLMSLVYSDYLGQNPCGLCWLQRIFIYSQVVLYAVAYIKNDLKVFSYTIGLSIVGIIIAIYHEWLQLGYNELIPCPTVPGFADCAVPTFIKYGFVTMPFLSIVLFLLLILLSIIVNKKVN